MEGGGRGVAVSQNDAARYTVYIFGRRVYTLARPRILLVSRFARDQPIETAERRTRIRRESFVRRPSLRGFPSEVATMRVTRRRRSPRGRRTSQTPLAATRILRASSEQRLARTIRRALDERRRDRRRDSDNSTKQPATNWRRCVNAPFYLPYVSLGRPIAGFAPVHVHGTRAPVCGQSRFGSVYVCRTAVAGDGVL